MIRFININGVNYILFTLEGFVSVLKPDKELYEKDMKEIERLFMEEYNKYKLL